MKPDEVSALLVLVVDVIDPPEVILGRSVDWAVRSLFLTGEGPFDEVLSVGGTSLIVEARGCSFEVGSVGLYSGAMIRGSALNRVGPFRRARACGESTRTTGFFGV